jgi:hypothetical protein
MRNVFLALLAGIIALGLVACGQEGEEAPTAAASPATTSTATPRATPTPEPTPTPEAAPKETSTPEAPQVTTQSFEGFGEQASPPFELRKGLAIFTMTHSGSSGFFVNLLDEQGEEFLPLLTYQIGSFEGSTALGFDEDEAGTYALDVTADGAWTVVVEQLEPTVAPSVPQTFTGVGPAASPFFHLEAGPTTFHMIHDGPSNFAIELWDSHGNYVDLLVNEIGPFDGSKVIQAPAAGVYILDIDADGNWGVAIEQ